MSAGDAGSSREALFAAFESKFGVRPEFYCRAPGRVNLIGAGFEIVCSHCLNQANNKTSSNIT